MANSTTLAKALLGFQSAAPALQRDKINPHFRSKYISLESLMEQVLPILNENGLVLVQQPTFQENAGENGSSSLVPALTTTLLHADSGEKIESTMLLQAGKNDPQGQGAAITYARRQAAMSMLGLVADADDDGNRATPKPTAAKPATAARAARTGASTAKPAADTPKPETAAEAAVDDPERTKQLLGMAHEIIANIQLDFGDHPEGMPWAQRMDEKCAEWFNKSLGDLDTNEATLLVQRLRATKTKLVADSKKDS